MKSGLPNSFPEAAAAAVVVVVELVGTGPVSAAFAEVRRAGFAADLGSLCTEESGPADPALDQILVAGMQKAVAVDSRSLGAFDIPSAGAASGSPCTGAAFAEAAVQNQSAAEQRGLAAAAVVAEG